MNAIDPKQKSSTPSTPISTLSLRPQEILSRFPLPAARKDRVSGHDRRSVAADQHSYLKEKRRGFDFCAARLRGILQPSTGDNVIELHRWPGT
jgi:hypothetical protein